MPAISRIPVSKVVWGELAGLKKPGETYDHLLEGMIEREKKPRLFEDMDRIEKRGRFVAMKWRTFEDFEKLINRNAYILL